MFGQNVMCGTYAGWGRHRRNSEIPCQACVLAYNEYQQDYRKKNPSTKKRIYKQRKSNPIYAHAYYEKNKETIQQKHAIYKKENKHIAVVSSHKRRAKIAKVFHVPYTQTEVLEAYGQNCHLCLQPIDLDASRRAGYGNWELGLHLDHVVPIAKNGSDTLENIRPTHAKCNLRKAQKVI
jgi:5-methylcytosine-specific restriction endonuclease McrA